jgi:hypothetical protein
VIILVGLLLIALGAGFVFDYRGMAAWGSQSQWGRDRVQPVFVARLTGGGFVVIGAACLVHEIF